MICGFTYARFREHVSRIQSLVKSVKNRSSGLKDVVVFLDEICSTREKCIGTFFHAAHFSDLPNDDHVSRQCECEHRIPLRDVDQVADLFYILRFLAREYSQWTRYVLMDTKFISGEPLFKLNYSPLQDVVLPFHQFPAFSSNEMVDSLCHYFKLSPEDFMKADRELLSTLSGRPRWFCLSFMPVFCRKLEIVKPGRTREFFVCSRTVVPQSFADGVGMLSYNTLEPLGLGLGCGYQL